MKMNRYLTACMIYNAVVLIASVSSTKIYTVNEEEGERSYIGNVPEDFELPPLSDSDAPRYYQIIKGGNLIRVNNATGDLFTLVQLDREKLCPSNPPECVLNVEVVVLPEIYFKSLNVQIKIKDLNDNVPHFQVNPMVRDISESAAKGTIIRLDSALDPDLGRNSIKSYRLRSSPPGPNENGTQVPFFRLDVINNIDGTQIPQLLLTSKLDREKISSYELLLYAIDGGRRPKTGTATVQITVTDSNDNQPEFEKSRYNIQVKENVKPGYVVARLTATDLDEGHNARIEYAFPNYVSEHDRSVFDLNSTSGILSVKSPGLDYENRTIHHLTVEARDGGPNSNPAYATVTVQVEDVNDEPPVIDINFANNALDGKGETTGDDGQPKPVLIKENLPVGTFIAFVTVTDRDTGMSGNVSCKLKQSDSFVMKKRNAAEDNGYLIRTKTILDRETKRYHTFEIEAWDFGVPSLSSSVTRVVELVDENDNDPSFGKDIYHLSVKENVKPGSIIAPLKAKDDDDGDNARVTYSAEPLKKGSVVPFTIDPESGDIKFALNAPPLDAENFTGPFRLRVIATDNGMPRRNTSTILEISVTDENDNAPRFEQKNYVFRIAENEKVGKYIGSVKANDSDIDKSTNGKITYGFLEGGTPFTINPEKGDITFSGSPADIDRETHGAQPYVLTVRAADSGDKPMHDEAIVEIYLLDVNDNAPVITYPNVTRDITYLYITSPQSKTSTRTFKRALNMLTESHDNNATAKPTISRKPKAQKSHLKRSILIGSSKTDQVHQPPSLPVTLLEIKAADPDEGENGRVRYVLTRGNDNSYFEVNPHSGNVTLAIKDERSLRAINRGCHVIEVEVKDLGKPILESTTWINIYVTDARPGSLNKSLVMRECMNNSYYPLQFLPPNHSAGGLEVTWWLILIFVVVGILFIIITVVLLIKCGCCGKPRNYNCKKETDIYGNTALYSRGTSANGKKSSKHPAADGTLDSRTSFIMASQQEKGPSDRSEESVHSRGSGKDSGTGDSMPSETYHNAPGYNRQPQREQYGHVPNYGMPPQPTHVYLPSQDDIMANVDDDGRFGGQQFFSTRCTEECRTQGHSDLCWMPESKQRPSRMTPLHTGVEEYDSGSLKYRKRSMTPNFYQDNADNPRYVSIPSSTPYYYDPGSKFDNGSGHPASMPMYHEDPHESDAGSVPYSQIPPPNMAGAMMMQPYHQPGYPAGVGYARSPIPYSTQSPAPYVGPAQRGKPYLPGLYEQENAESLSSHGSANRYPNQGYSHPAYAHEQGYPAAYQPGYHTEGYDDRARNGPYEGVPQGFDNGPQYEDEFAASNLLSPAYSESADYKHALERQMLQYQQQSQPVHGYPNTIEPEKNRKRSGTQVNPPNEQPDSIDEKLGPLREELDADQVVAEIDGLLL